MKLDSEFDYTEPEVWAFLDDKFHFTLDAAASEQNHRCADYLSRERDAFKTPWYGRVFCNPSWGSGLNKWVERALEQRVNTELIVLLLPYRVHSKWFKLLKINNIRIDILSGKAQVEGSKRIHEFHSIVAILGGKA